MEAMALSADPNFPKALDSPLDYDAKSLKVRVEWGKTLKKRKFTPRSEAFAAGYLEIAEEALAVDDDDELSDSEKLNLKEKVFRLDQFLQRNEDLWYIPTPAMQKLADQAALLTKLELYGRYGDYMNIELAQVRDATRKLEELKKYKPIFANYWTSIQTKIESEEGVVESEKTMENQSTIVAVRACAKALNIPEEHLLETIKHYANRNERFHSDIERLVSIGKGPPLANKIFGDLKYVQDCLDTATQDREFLTYLKIIVERLRDDWFVFRREGDKEDPEYWELSDKARSLRSGKDEATGAAIAEYKEQLKGISENSFQEVIRQYHGLRLVMSHKRRVRSEAQGYVQEAKRRTGKVEMIQNLHEALMDEPRYRQLMDLTETLDRFGQDYPAH
ncbi:hypothetical protein LTR84_010428 [Exophiala bonariae]|uniref:SPX domain-containing protein n=1 Tax=Exophiala bonariae TaxID=1690606 RepID=A0AAV9MT19_9EURO|nr:hypothetical protein LTR84_010428 [Exophiala bonariae]